MKGGGVLLQGHHLNDQAETVLMRALKGAGPELLKGIPKKRPVSEGMLYRPWLDLSRELLEDSARNHSLLWVEDESNKDVQFERNYLRNEILPLLKERQLSVFSDLGKVAKKAQDAFDFIQDWCRCQQEALLSQKYAKQMAIEVSSLKEYSIQQQAYHP